MLIAVTKATTDALRKVEPLLLPPVATVVGGTVGTAVVTEPVGATEVAGATEVDAGTGVVTATVVGATTTYEGSL